LSGFSAADIFYEKALDKDKKTTKKTQSSLTLLVIVILEGGIRKPNSAEYNWQHANCFSLNLVCIFNYGFSIGIKYAINFKEFKCHNNSA